LIGNPQFYTIKQNPKNIVRKKIANLCLCVVLNNTMVIFFHCYSFPFIIFLSASVTPFSSFRLRVGTLLRHLPFFNITVFQFYKLAHSFLLDTICIHKLRSRVMKTKFARWQDKNACPGESSSSLSECSG
jgi:hypothetical protein